MKFVIAVLIGAASCRLPSSCDKDGKCPVDHCCATLTGGDPEKAKDYGTMPETIERDFDAYHASTQEKGVCLNNKAGAKGVYIYDEAPATGNPDMRGAEVEWACRGGARGPNADGSSDGKDDGHITLEHMTKHACGNTPLGAKDCDREDFCCGRITYIDYTSAENWKILTDSGDKALIEKTRVMMEKALEPAMEGFQYAGICLQSDRKSAILDSVQMKVNYECVDPSSFKMPTKEMKDGTKSDSKGSGTKTGPDDCSYASGSRNTCGRGLCCARATSMDLSGTSVPAGDHAQYQKLVEGSMDKDHKEGKGYCMSQYDDVWHQPDGPIKGAKVTYECMSGGSDSKKDGKRRGGDSDSDSEDMAEEYWNRYARMNFKQFSQGYRHAEPGVTDEQIRDHFLWGDKNGDFELDFNEFDRLVAMNQGPPKDDHAKMRWYWKHFASYKAKGMTEEEFYEGSQVENQGMSWDEAMGYFHQLDHNEDGRLSRNEFFSMSEMDGHDGKKEEDMNADDYWQKFAKDGHMKWIDFKRAYEHAEPGVGYQQIDEAWNQGDRNGDSRLTREEFMELVKNMTEQEMSADEVWKQFAGPEGMKFAHFEKAVRSKEANVSMDMIKKAWDQGDRDGNDHMSYDEFMRLVKEMENH